MKRVVLMVDSLDDVVDVVEQSTGASLAFDIHPLQSAPGDLDPRIRTACLPAQIEPAVQRALNASVRLGGASECVPLPNCAYEGRALRGCVHLLPPDGEPSTEACGWPLSLRYATGLSIIELERKLFNGTYLSPDFFRSPEFKVIFFYCFVFFVLFLHQHYPSRRLGLRRLCRICAFRGGRRPAW